MLLCQTHEFIMHTRPVQDVSVLQNTNLKYGENGFCLQPFLLSFFFLKIFFFYFSLLINEQFDSNSLFKSNRNFQAKSEAFKS